MQKKILLWLLFLLAINSLFANAPTAFQQATEAYQNKNFQRAIELYEGLLAQDQQSKELLYNLANSYYKTGQLGKAVLYYEKTLLLAPRDADTQHNLAVVRQSLSDEIEELPSFFLARWWNSLASVFGSTGWSVLAILMLWLAIGGLAVWLLGKNRSQKKRGFISGLTLLSLSVLFFALAYTRYQQVTNSPYAIIMPQEVRLRAAPDAESKVFFPLHEGTKVAIQDQIGDWFKVRLANGEVGWLAQGEVERL